MLSGSYHKAPNTHPNGAGNSDPLKLNIGNGLVVGDSGCSGIALLACLASKEVSAVIARRQTVVGMGGNK